MRVLVIGAAGFVGEGLVQRLLQAGSVAGQKIERLFLLDQCFHESFCSPPAHCVTGSYADPALVRRLLADGIDLVFHLASVPGGAAEDSFDTGCAVNLTGSLGLLQQLRAQQRVPTLVYASSIAVYGGGLPAEMDESYPPAPQLSYGTHKLMIEQFISDLNRRGELNGRALRLPGIVTRPGNPGGLRSAFMSSLFQAFKRSEPYTCPVSAGATAWWMSQQCCVDNLLHAADSRNNDLNGVWQLPVLRLCVEEVVDALQTRYGLEQQALVDYAPESDLEALFGRFPPLATPVAEAAGFRHDRSVDELVSRATGDILPREKSGPGRASVLS